MLVISMRTRRFHGIKASIIMINPGKSVLVLADALAAFSSSVSTALTVLIVSTVSDALIVSDAAVAAEAVVAAAAVVDNHESIKQSLLYCKRKAPAFCRGSSLEGKTYETKPGT